jgi:hypothetical protein
MTQRSEMAHKGIEGFEVDPLARRILARVPDDLAEDVLRSIALHGLIYYTTSGLGQAVGDDEVKLGVEALQKRGVLQIVPIGKITPKIYFQNGWLMIKLAGLPESTGTQIKKGDRINRLFEVAVKDGAGGKVEPFKNAVISQRMTGRTWMGPHVMVRLEEI